MTNYVPYWKGYNLDFGGVNFNSVERLKSHIDNFTMSNNQYNKYKHMPDLTDGKVTESLWSEPVGDEIINALESGNITDATKSVKTVPTFRYDVDTVETTFDFKISNKEVNVLFINSPHRARQIIITINSKFTRIPLDSPYREEILKKCEENII